MRSLFLTVLFVASSAVAEPALLQDLNADGMVTIYALGDSITFGVGDGTLPGAVISSVPQTDGTLGYPKRIMELAGVLVINGGIPGEEFAIDGAERFPRAVTSSGADMLIIFEGTNDGVHRLAINEYQRLMQRSVNVAVASGKTPVLATLPPPCCDHSGQELFTNAYSSVVRTVSSLNDIHYADIERAWHTTCNEITSCDLYNLPEGLHPNTKGYDVIAQTLLATFYEIDIFAEDGAAKLESALGLLPGAVVVEPDL